MLAYDPNMHQKFAETLLRRAKRISLVFTAMAAIVGAGIGIAMPRMVGKPSTALPVVLWTFVMGVFGFVTGKERSFTLSLKAQELLCQRQIEENTRKVEMASSAAAK